MSEPIKKDKAHLVPSMFSDPLYVSFQQTKTVYENCLKDGKEPAVIAASFSTFKEAEQKWYEFLINKWGASSLLAFNGVKGNFIN